MTFRVLNKGHFLLECPLSIQISKCSRKTGKPRYVQLNLNVYRNTNFIVLNNIKKKFNEVMAEQLSQLPQLNQITLHYRVYPKTARTLDIMNIATVVDKFFCDALVVSGKLPDDNFNYIKAVKITYGNPDKDNPRCVVFVKEIDL